MAEVLALHEPDAHEPPKLLFADDESLRVLIPGADSLRADPVFGDDCWELAGHPSWGGKVGRQTSLDFRRLSPRWRVAAKEMCLLQMQPSLAHDRAPDERAAY